MIGKRIHSCEPRVFFSKKKSRRSVRRDRREEEEKDLFGQVRSLLQNLDGLVGNHGREYARLEAHQGGWLVSLSFLSPVSPPDVRAEGDTACVADKLVYFDISMNYINASL